MSERFKDVIALPKESNRTVTSDGYLTAPAILARAGVFKYYAGEIGLSDRKASDVVSVYRSADSLKKAIESFESQPVTLDHKWTTAKNWKKNAIGDVRDVEMKNSDMAGTLIVRDADGVKAIDSGLSQLSNGYTARLLKKPGTFDGQPYEYEQVDITGNHVAIVSAARCGAECRIGDSDHELNFAAREENTMSVQRTHDGLTVTLENEQSGQVFDRLTRSLETITTERDALKTAPPKVKLGDKELTGEEVTTLVAAKDGEITALKAGAQTPEQIHAMVVARSNAITSARDMVPDLKVGDADTAHTIRVAALDAVAKTDEMAKSMLDAALGTTKLAEAQEPVVATAFNTISAGLKKAKDTRRVVDSRRQVGALATAGGSGTADEKDPRAAYMDTMSTAWKGPQAHSKTEVN